MKQTQKKVKAARPPRKRHPSRIQPVFLIFRHDVRTAFKNISTIIIVLGLCFLPSLYAWINIYACWDPYANTGNLPIAVVNNDRGTVYNGKVINAGNQIAAELKKNKTIGWEFPDEWQANYGLNEGKYYAVIEIPDNFSAQLSTLTSATPQKPVVAYRVNEKLNSIATKITDAAKNKLVENIKANFVKTVTTEVIHTLTTEMKNNKLNVSQIKELKTTLTELSTSVAQLKKYIADADADSQNFQKYMDQNAALLPKVSAQMDSLQKILDADKALAESTRSTISSVSSDLNTDAQQLTLLDSLNQQMIANLKAANGNTLNADALGTMEHCSSICSAADVLLKNDIQNLKSVEEEYNLPALAQTANALAYADRLVLNEKAALNQQIPVLNADTSAKSVEAALTSLSGLSHELTTQVTTLSGKVQPAAMDTLNSFTTSFELQLDDAGSMQQLTRSLAPQLSALAAFSSANTKLTSSQAKELGNRLTHMSNDLAVLQKKVNSVSESDLAYLNDLAENHPKEIAEFISSPIAVKEVDVYHSTTFGVGVTPFYTVLAIWIGALLSCALLAVNYEGSVIEGVRLNLIQKHFGKMLLFLALSFIQSTIITLGDVFLLKVNPVDFWLMLAVSWLTSITFTIIIFTLVSLFGNVGKAAAVLMMVFQIAGAGGIYPIQTNPHIFGMLAPLWPFSYAIDYFREAIAGPMWSSVIYNVKAMLVFCAAFLLLACLKKPLHQMNTALEHIYKQAKI